MFSYWMSASLWAFVPIASSSWSGPEGILSLANYTCTIKNLNEVKYILAIVNIVNWKVYGSSTYQTTKILLII